ncbi:hypothetical protein [Gordonia polyisoprenivorans]|nr:hypothetical protein [Gordonia polyisoprenivorans]WCB40280.1 hypothetical protein PHA63_01390 [Gordonia polyisoprenivorans]
MAFRTARSRAVVGAHRHHDGRLIAVLDELGIENDQLLDSQ